MSNLIALLTPDINYRSLSYAVNSSDLRKIKGEIGMNVTLAAKDAQDDDWKIIASKDKLKRTLNCEILTEKVNFLFYSPLFIINIIES